MCQALSTRQNVPCGEELPRCGFFRRQKQHAQQFGCKKVTFLFFSFPKFIQIGLEPLLSKAADWLKQIINRCLSPLMSQNLCTLSALKWLKKHLQTSRTLSVYTASCFCSCFALVFRIHNECRQSRSFVIETAMIKQKWINVRSLASVTSDWAVVLIVWAAHQTVELVYVQDHGWPFCWKSNMIHCDAGLLISCMSGNRLQYCKAGLQLICISLSIHLETIS